ncbi:MAG: LptF/LptG family permease [Planctomycetes bacterium]|nr:LptF/LptG family permease [Planctomycetota bacterium]
MPRIRLPRLSLLERYILRETFAPFLVALASVTAIMVMGTAFKLLMRTKGVDLVAIVQVTPFMVPYVLVHVVPVAILMGTITAYTRLAGDREITAMKLTGLPITRLLTPPVFAGVALGLLSLLSANYLTPRSREQLAQLYRTTVIQILSQLQESRNSVVFDEGRSRFLWKIHWQGVVDGKLDDLVIYREPRPDAGADAGVDTPEAECLYASRGSFRLDPYDNLIKFELEGLLGYYDLAARDFPNRDAGTPPPAVLGGALHDARHERKLAVRGERFAVTLDLNVGEKEDDLRESTKNRDIDSLMAFYARDLAGTRLAREAILLELGRRLGEALACLSFALLGTAVGLLFRGPNRVLAYVLGCLLALLIFYPLSRAGETAAEAGLLPALLALQLGNIVLVLLAVVLLRRGVR